MVLVVAFSVEDGAPYLLIRKGRNKSDLQLPQIAAPKTPGRIKTYIHFRVPELSFPRKTASKMMRFIFILRPT